MKKHYDIGWGIANGGALIYGTIRTTRRDAISDAFISRGVDPSINGPTVLNLRLGYPHLQVVRIVMEWDEPKP
jgi:hypothetical protein